MPVGIASRFCDTGTDLIQVGVSLCEDSPPRHLELIVVLTLANPAAADQIVLKNGDRLTGTIVKSDGKTLVLKSDLVGEVAIALDDIANVTADKPLYVTLSDGRTVSGLVTAKNSQFEIKSNNGAVVVERSAIAMVRSEAEQRAYESTLNPGWFEQWSGGADLGFALTRGSSHTTNVALGMAISRASVRVTIATSTASGLAMGSRISNTTVFRT